MEELNTFRQYLTEARYNKKTMNAIVDFAMRFAEDEWNIANIDSLRHYKYKSYSELVKELVKQIEDKYHSSVYRAVNREFNLDIK